MFSRVIARLNEKVSWTLRNWSYPRLDGGRDERIDFLRGLTMLVVIINHLMIPSLFQIITVEAIGVITGAECFVFLSGMMIGVIYNKQIKKNGLLKSSSKLFKRAVRIYLAALSANILIYILEVLSIIDLSVLTTWTDMKSGAVFQLYGTGTVNAEFIAGFIFLKYGPSQINILGLYVILVALAPLMLTMLYFGQAKILLAASWIIYLTGQNFPNGILPMQSENSFPVMVWQLLFSHGVLFGYYKSSWRNSLSTRHFKVILSVSLFLFFLLSFFALNNPWYKIPLQMRFHLIPENLFQRVYENFFQRSILGIGRFINTLVVMAVLLQTLSLLWTPIKKIFGWLCIPIGRASLAVFIIHIFFIAAVHNIDPLNHNNLKFNTLAAALVILLIRISIMPAEHLQLNKEKR